MNWDDPVERYRLIERVGPAEYERLQAEHFKASTVATVNGRAIRPVGSRFGRIFIIDGAGVGFAPWSRPGLTRRRSRQAMPNEDQNKRREALKCVLCGSVIDDRRQAHNAAPLASGFCCTACNVARVLPARIAAVTPQRSS